MRRDRIEWISEQQRKLWRSSRLRLNPTTYADYSGNARWLELEALRGYGYDWIVPETKTTSSERLRRSASIQRWLAELALLHGPGNGKELLARAGAKMPDLDDPNFWGA